MKKAVRYLLPLIAAIALSFPVAAGATEITQLTPDQITAALAAAEAQQAAQQQALNALNEQLAAINKAQMEAQAAATKEAQRQAAEAQKLAQQQAAEAQKLAQQQAEAARLAAIQKQAEDAAASGMTYVDISIDNQTLTYFVNGNVAITTPCVTGGPKNSTPRGVFSINTMTPGKYLTGPTWHVWVNRWMRFCGNCGIHDASWRKSFGGNIYKHNGSHGCVNIPRDVANQLYNMVGLGTVVIVH